MKKILLTILGIVVASGIFYAANYAYGLHKYNFTAQSVKGEVSMGDFDGKYKIVYFGYVFCPDVCPTTLNLVSSVLEDLKVQNLEILFATLDIKRDDVKSCDEFAKYFYKDSTCLVMSESELERVTKNYGAKYKIIDLNDSVMGYSVAHSSMIYLFDKNGRFVSEVSNLTYDNVKKEIKNLIKNY